VALGEMGELEAATRADHEHAAVVRHRLRQDLLDDAVQDVEAWDRPASPLGVRRYRRRVGEEVGRHRDQEGRCITASKPI